MNTNSLDLILGILAILIVIGGLIMLLSGVSKMNDWFTTARDGQNCSKIKKC